MPVGLILAAIASSCDSVDDDRIPPAPVRIDFAGQGEWDVYGVGGALQWREFIKSQRLPLGFPYSDASQTGYAGVVLVGDFVGEPQAYDLSCPVEMKRDVRVSVDPDQAVARCLVCGSTYDIFRQGAPLSGKAAEKGYAMRKYRVGMKSDGSRWIGN